MKKKSVIVLELFILLILSCNIGYCSITCDLEDAKHLYSLFKEKLDIELLSDFNQKLKIEGLFDKYLR